MEKIQINDEEYAIKSIRQLSAEVLEITFAEDVPTRWGDISLYTAGGVLAAQFTGYNTVLVVDGQTVQLANNPDAVPEQPGEQPEPYYKQLEKMMTSMQSRNMILEQAVSFAAVSFTDEQALQVAAVYPEYMVGVAYKKGDRFRYDDVLYKVLQDHISQADWTPDAAPSLYARVLVTNPDVIPDWEQPDSTNGYSVGDKVHHNGKTWESLVDNNVWEPGVVGTEGLWKEVTMNDNSSF